ncbi:MAG: TonB family protein [Pseudomonadota bacterium]
MPPKTARAASPPTDPPRRAPAAPAKDALAKAAPEPSSGSGTESAQASVAAGSGGGPQDGAGDAAETAGGASSGGAELAKIWGGRIRREVERKKTYPRSLRRSGSVLIAMTVERGGRLMQAKIQESSGSDGLDAAAMTAVKAAAPYVAAPAGLSGTSFKFVLPVVFKR